MFYLFSICNATPDPDLSCDSQVQYCCQDHKELHFPAEQDQPYPFIVKYRPEVGRYMVASRYIPNHTNFSTWSISRKGETFDTFKIRYISSWSHLVPISFLKSVSPISGRYLSISVTIQYSYYINTNDNRQLLPE